MMPTKPSMAVVATLLALGLYGLGIVGIQFSSAEDPKAAAPKPPEEAHSRGLVFAVLRVTDSGTRVQRQERRVIARLPERKVETIAASPGCVILGVKFPQPKNAALGDLQVIVTTDRSAVELTADRVGGKGSDAVDFPLTVIEERASEVRGPTQKLAVCSEPVFDFQPTEYALPPIPSELVQPRRRIDVEVRAAAEGGGSKLLPSEVDIHLPWKGEVFRSKTAAFHLTVAQEGDRLQVYRGWMFR